MNLLLYMAPVAVVLLLPATLFMEENVVGKTIALAREDFKIVWYLLFNSCLAYFVNLTNFLVTKHTSPLTLQVRTSCSQPYLFLNISLTWFLYEIHLVHNVIHARAHNSYDQYTKKVFSLKIYNVSLPEITVSQEKLKSGKLGLGCDVQFCNCGIDLG